MRRGSRRQVLRIVVLKPTGSPATREAAHWDLLKVTRVMLSHAEAALETLRALRSRALRPRQPARRRSSRAS